MPAYVTLPTYVLSAACVTSAVCPMSHWLPYHSLLDRPCFASSIYHLLGSVFQQAFEQVPNLFSD